jgi:hypothetical protein
MNNFRELHPINDDCFTLSSKNYPLEFYTDFEKALKKSNDCYLSLVPKELHALFEETRLTYHPELIKFFYDLSNKLLQDEEE